MNINALIQGFAGYLDELSQISNKNYNTQATNASIFMYSSEFKQYLENEMGADSSISSMSVSDLLSMDFENGKFVKPDGNEDDNAGINDILNDLFNDDSVKKTVDTDGNGEISGEEKNAFIDALKNLDNDAENISMDDIFGAVKGIKDGSFKIERETLPMESPENSETPESTDENGNAAEAANGASGAQNSGSSGSSGNSGNASSANNAGNGAYNADTTGAQEKTLDNMSEDELKSELSTAQSTLTDKQNALNAILDGSDAAIQELQGKVDEAYDAYQTKLKEVDEDMAGKVDELKNKITAKESEISAKEGEISTQEGVVSDCTTAYDNAVSKRQNLESILGSLTSEDENYSSVQSDLAAAKADEAAALAKKEEAEAKLETLNEEKTKLQSEGDESLDALNTQMSALEQEISQKYPEVQESMDAYNQAKEALQTGKETAATTAKNEVQEAQDYVNKVQTAIQNCDNKKDNSKYMASGDSSKTVENAMKYLGMSEAQVEKLTGKGFVNGLWCADFVHAVLSETYGEENLPDWYKNCSGKSTCANVLSAAQSAGKAFKDSSQAKPGDLIVFNTKRGQAKHIGIVVKVENGVVYTIEGNSTGGKCCQRQYSVTNTSRINSYISM
ncbi:CHAP domain-containing protein [bacterium]|nr:CHAP domain-containing protein [bacterium]